MDTTTLVNSQNQVSLEIEASIWTWFQLSGCTKDGLPYVLAVNGIDCGGLVARDAKSPDFLAFFKVADDNGIFPRDAEHIKRGRLHQCMQATNARLALQGDLPRDFEKTESSAFATPGQIALLQKHGQYLPKDASRLAASVGISANFFGRSFQKMTGSRLRLNVGETALYKPSTWRVAA